MDELESLQQLSEQQLIIMLQCANLDQVSKTLSNTLSLVFAHMHYLAKQRTAEAKEVM